jgi:hypothetical protein
MLGRVRLLPLSLKDPTGIASTYHSHSPAKVRFDQPLYEIQSRIELVRKLILRRIAPHNIASEDIDSFA